MKPYNNPAFSPLSGIRLAFICLSLLTTSCMSYKRIPEKEDGTPAIGKAIDPGDYVRLILKSGKRIERMKVTKMDREKITGVVLTIDDNGRNLSSDQKRETFFYKDIRVARKRKFSALKTTAFIVAIGAVEAVILKSALENGGYGPNLSGLGSSISGYLQGMR